MICTWKSQCWFIKWKILHSVGSKAERLVWNSNSWDTKVTVQFEFWNWNSYITSYFLETLLLLLAFWSRIFGRGDIRVSVLGDTIGEGRLGLLWSQLQMMHFAYLLDWISSEKEGKESTRVWESICLYEFWEALLYCIYWKLESWMPQEYS